GFIANMELQPEAPLNSAPADRQKLTLNEENLSGGQERSDLGKDPA
ncbi:MAG: hypothetical protein QOG79_7121, partial [Mycobacterium sp.]|nr:hypothetical protein [Mycobacterium sp.]